MSAIPSWLWISLGASLLIAGAWLLIRGRPFRRTVRGRLCRDCRYNMEGLATLRCPECGRVAQDEREFRRLPARRSWRVAGAAALFSGLACFSAPRTIEQGWPGAVPDWLLVLIAPLAPPPAPSAWAIFALSPPPADPTIGERLNVEVVRRIKAGEMSKSATVYFLQRAFELRTGDRPRTLKFPAEWPSDVPFSAYLILPNPHQSLINISCRTELVKTPPDHASVRYAVITAVNGPELVVCTYEHSIDISRSANTFMRPLTTPKFDAAVARAINPRLRIESRDVHLIFDRRESTALWDAAQCFLAYDVTVTLDGKVIGNSASGSGREPLTGPAIYSVPIVWSAEGQAALLAHPERVRLTIAGAPGRCVHEFVNRCWTYPAEAWAGSVTITPPLERSP